MELLKLRKQNRLHGLGEVEGSRHVETPFLPKKAGMCQDFFLNNSLKFYLRALSIDARTRAVEALCRLQYDEFCRRHACRYSRLQPTRLPLQSGE
jgi:hypothetical protein